MQQSPQTTGATRRLAQHASSLRYEQLPAVLVERIKQCVLDTLGVSIGASTLSEEAGIVADYVRALGGAPESRILGFGGRAPAAWAVFANGSLGHMLDYDDVGGGGHVSIATIPVALALAEKQGGVTGRELIAAIAAGTDIHVRLNQAIDIPDWTMAEGWFATQLFGFVSGAATAARLLRLDADRTEHAFGIAYTQMSGSRQMAVGTATHLRSMQAGFSGQGAVLAAELAQRGIVGSREIVEGRYGIFHNYVRTEHPDWDAMLDGLGERFPMMDVHGFKVWPACGYTRPTNAAILELRREHGLTPEDVEEIAIIGGTGATRLLSEPLELKRRPKLSIDGKYSIPFTTAVMMVNGNVTLRDYTDEGLRDPRVLAMADRIVYRPDPDASLPLGGNSTVSRPTVEVRLKNGRVLSRRVDGVPGDPRHPVTARHARNEVPGLRVLRRRAGRAAQYRRRRSACSRPRQCCRCRRDHPPADTAGSGVVAFLIGETGMSSPRNGTIEISFIGTGDCGPVHGPADGFPIERYTELVRPTLQGVDLRFANCERQYSSRGQASETSPHGRQPPEMAQIFTDCGFDAVTIANNHMYDYGPDALLDTRSLLLEKGIGVTGAGRDLDEARRPAIVERNGIKVGFLGYCSVIPEGGEAAPGKVGIAPLRVKTEYEPRGPHAAPRVITSPDEQDMAMILDDVSAAARGGRHRGGGVSLGRHLGAAGYRRLPGDSSARLHRRRGGPDPRASRARTQGDRGLQGQGDLLQPQQFLHDQAVSVTQVE